MVIVALVKVAFVSDKLLTVRLLTVRFVMSALVLLSVLIVPLVELRFVNVAELLVSVVIFPLTAVSESAFVIVALSSVLPLSVVGTSALTIARNEGSTFGPLVGPANIVFAPTGVSS